MIGRARSAAYTRHSMPLETEIKFRVDDPDALGLRLDAAGFRLQTARSFESNVLYDTPDRRMRARTEILRIRNYAGCWTLTHKRLPTDGPGEDRHKHRIETETAIADGNALADVFLSLGLVPAFRYEKWRTEWTDGEGHCVVDETPIGRLRRAGGPARVDRPRGGSTGHRSRPIHHSQLWPFVRLVARRAPQPGPGSDIRRSHWHHVIIRCTHTSGTALFILRPSKMSSSLSIRTAGSVRNMSGL